jgi:hypothetical protein
VVIVAKITKSLSLVEIEPCHLSYRPRVLKLQFRKRLILGAKYEKQFIYKPVINTYFERL